MAFVVLDELTAKASNEFAQFLDFKPRFASKFFPMVYGEDYLGSYAMGAKPGDGPEIETQAVDPGLLSGVGKSAIGGKARAHV
jgi:hypothetical protein